MGRAIADTLTALSLDVCGVIASYVCWKQESRYTSPHCRVGIESRLCRGLLESLCVNGIDSKVQHYIHGIVRMTTSTDPLVALLPLLGGFDTVMEANSETGRWAVYVAALVQLLCADSYDAYPSSPLGENDPSASRLHYINRCCAVFRAAGRCHVCSDAATSRYDAGSDVRCDAGTAVRCADRRCIHSSGSRQPPSVSQWLLAYSSYCCCSRPHIRFYRRQPHVIVATPGRLIDHVSKNSLSLGSVRMLVMEIDNHDVCVKQVC